MSTSRTLKVGIPVSLSGQFHVQGAQALAGLRTWADDVNRSGGLSIGNRGAPWQILLVHYDDESIQESARLATERLIDVDRVDLLFGPYSGSLTEAACEIAEAREKLLWNQGGASDTIYQRGYKWLAGILTPASEYLAGLLPLVRQADPQAVSVAILRASRGAFPRVVSSAVEQQAAALGFRLDCCREYDPATTDLSGLLDEIAEHQPDVLLGVGRIRNDLLLARQLVESRVRPKAVAIVATPIEEFQEALAGDSDGFIGPSQWESSANYPIDYGPTAAQVLESLGRYGHHRVDYPMVQSYAAGVVAQRCVEASESLEDRVLRDTAGKLDFSTFYGRFKIDPATGRQVGHSVLLVQRQASQKVVVWPPEQRQCALAYPWRDAARTPDTGC